MSGGVFVLLALALLAWAGGLVSILRAQRRFSPWVKPLVARGEVPPCHGTRVPIVIWRRLYGRQAEADPEAERLRREARRWHARFVACGLAFLVLVLALWLMAGG